MIYLDSCAMVKLIREEGESAALQAWLDEHPGVEYVTSELACAELPRVVRRNNYTDQGVVIDAEALRRELTEAEDLLDAIDVIVLDADVLEQAAAIESPFLKTLDAIHLASAAQLGSAITEFITYDRGLRRAAANEAIATSAPC